MTRPAQPLPLLQPVAAVALIIGIVVGAGIFKTPSLVAGISGDAGWALVIWAVGALMSVAGALCYAELCTAYPHAGGDYHFLQRAFGRDLAFLYAWSRAVIINPGSVALLAFVFGDYMTSLWSWGAHSSAIWAVAVVMGLTAINLVGLRASSRLQTLLTGLELLGLLSVVAAGLWVLPSPGSSTIGFGSMPSPGQWGLCLVFVLLTFGGWNESAYVSAEVRGGARVMVGVILISIAVIAALYLSVNAALLLGLGVEGLRDSKTAASDLLGLAFGPKAQQALGLVVAIAALTSINATLVVGSRSNYAVGRDWPALEGLGRWNERSGSPVTGLCLQAGVSLALIGLGTQQADGFAAMVEFTAPVFWAFLMGVGLAVMRLRRVDAQAPRPFKVPLYPLMPLVFCATCGGLVYSSIGYAVSQEAVHVSLLLLATGVLGLWVLKWYTRRS